MTHQRELKQLDDIEAALNTAFEHFGSGLAKSGLPFQVRKYLSERREAIDLETIQEYYTVDDPYSH